MERHEKSQDDKERHKKAQAQWHRMFPTQIKDNVLQGLCFSQSNDKYDELYFAGEKKN